jgi:hypothetical protein
MACMWWVQRTVSMQQATHTKALSRTLSLRSCWPTMLFLLFSSTSCDLNYFLPYVNIVTPPLMRWQIKLRDRIPSPMQPILENRSFVELATLTELQLTPVHRVSNLMHDPLCVSSSSSMPMWHSHTRNERCLVKLLVSRSYGGSPSWLF